PGDEDEQKARYVRGLGAATVVAIGQGANDGAMLKAAAIGIAVMGEEGLAVEALLSADVLAANIYDALNLLEYPTRLVATLRQQAASRESRPVARMTSSQFMTALPSATREHLPARLRQFKSAH